MKITIQKSHYAFNRARKHLTTKSLTKFKKKQGLGEQLKNNKMQSWRSYVLSITSQTTSEVCRIKLVNGLQSSSNIQFLETDGKFVTQSYDIANLLAEYKENSINKNNSSSYPTNYDTYIY